MIYSTLSCAAFSICIQGANPSRNNVPTGFVEVTVSAAAGLKTEIKSVISSQASSYKMTEIETMVEIKRDRVVITVMAKLPDYINDENGHQFATDFEKGIFDNFFENGIMKQTGKAQPVPWFMIPLNCVVLPFTMASNVIDCICNAINNKICDIIDARYERKNTQR